MQSFLNRRFDLWSIEQAAEVRGGGIGFVYVERMGSILICQHKQNSKNRSRQRMDGPDYRLTNFLTLLPTPKGLLPIPAAYHGLWGASADDRWHLPGRHGPCKDGTDTARAGLRYWVATISNI